MISRELAGFLESGLSILIGTRDGGMRPSGARVWAVRVSADGTRLTALVHPRAAAGVLRDLEDNGRAALVFGRPSDHRTVQVKGSFVERRAATKTDRAAVTRQLDGLRDELEGAGVHRQATAGWVATPCTAVTIRVEELFDQTPGPGAGERLR